MLAIGAVLTRRQVEHATLAGLAHQADLLAAREVFSIVPGATLPKIRTVLRRQQERVYVVALKRPSPFLPDDARRRVARGESVNGTETVSGTSYFFAARKLGKQTLVLSQALVL